MERIGMTHRRMVSFALAISLLVAFAAPASAQGTRGVVYRPPPGAERGLSSEATLYTSSIAVVIGVDAYETLPRLHGAVRDAQAVAEALTAQGMKVKTLIDKQATKEAIVAYLADELPNSLGPEDRVLVYFAGHGVSVGDGDKAMGYLMPIEGKRDRPISTGISMRELQAWFADYPAKHVMFVADACYSGLALSTRAAGIPSGLRDYLKQITSKPVRLALVAGGAGEEAHEWRGHGLFTTYFLDAISGSADSNNDGLITSDEIAAYVKPNVMQIAMSEFRATQQPLMGRHGEGEYVFLSPRGFVDPASAAPAAETPVPAPAADTGVAASLPPPPPAMEPVAADVAPRESDLADASSVSTMKKWGHGLLWPGVVAIGFGGISTALAAVHAERVQSYNDKEKEQRLSDLWWKMAWAGYGVGVVLAATGIPLLVIAKKKESSANVALAPLFDGQSAALLVRGEW